MKALTKLLMSIFKAFPLKKVFLLKKIKNKLYGKNMKILNKIKREESKN